MMKLTPRLAAAASLVPKSKVIADIGTDHGYIPIFLCEEGRTERAVASDIHKGPAEKAKEHVAAAGMGERIDVRLGGGLLPLREGEVEGAVICGMGGLMIASILEEGGRRADALQWVVLQPMNHGADLRNWLSAHGWAIEKEFLAEEERRIYDVLFCRHGRMALFSPLWAEIGPTRQDFKDPLMEAWLLLLIRKRKAALSAILSGEDTEKSRRQKDKLEAEVKELEELIWTYRQKI